MEFVNIDTTQNVNLEFKSASIGDRILAYCFDLLIILTWSITWTIIINKMGGFEVWNIVFSLPVVFYSLLCELLLNGQSFGKMVFKIKVVKLDGSELTLATCLVRWLFRIVDNLILFGSIAVLTIILSKKSQRLGDITAGTTVIKLNKANLFEDTSFVEVPESYDLKYPQVNLLNDTDANIIKDVLKLEKASGPGDVDSVESILKKTQRAIQQKLSLTEVEVEPKEFLKSVLIDYNHMNQ
ncbi:RDD family protein [Plebeiibacterium marinum]|uniref:RDD family protein n=1 Tax=Plebeiibacterium marinum TaxID=2992111 RepID=A0AAE3MI99_9BACT|nr:RDD family protein [Plebeiobacterium marinum]MCW3807885.1 RDD family protein [Plebeiobacterium marinum]